MKSFMNQFVWVTGGRLFGAVLQAVTLILLARHAGPADFGLFSAIYGMATVAQFAFDFGISAYVIKKRAERKDSPVIWHALRVNDWSSLALTVMAAAIVVLLAIYVNPTFLMTLPLAFWAASERNSDAWAGVALADGDAKLNTTALVIRRMATLGIYVVLAVASVHPLLSYSLAAALTATGSSMIVHALIRPRLSKTKDAPSLPLLLRQTWPFWLNSLGLQARNLDSAIVGLIAGPAQAGFYAAASRVTGPLRLVSTSLASVLLPASSGKTTGEIRHVLKRSLAILYGLTFIYALLWLFTPQLIELLLGSEYLGAILPVQIAIVGLPFAAASSILSSTLQGMGLQVFVGKTAISTTLSCLASISVLGALNGAVGAAIGLSLTFALQALVLGYKSIQVLARPERKAKMPRARTLFGSIAAQEDNLGDITIRKHFFEQFADSRNLVLFTGRMSKSHIAAYGLNDTVRLISNPASFQLMLLGHCLAGQADLAFAPGPALLRDSITSNGKMSINLLNCGLVKARGGFIIVTGRSLRGNGKLAIRLERLLAKMSDSYSVRDTVSGPLIGSNIQSIPDLGFMIESISGSDFVQKAFITFSFRSDVVVDIEWFQSMVSSCRRLGYIPVLATQVKRDDEQHRKLADLFDLDSHLWEGNDHIEQSELLEEVYAQSIAVISNRLHVLLIASAQGAIPVEFAPNGSDKISSTLGPHLTDLSTISGDVLRDSEILRSFSEEKRHKLEADMRCTKEELHAYLNALQLNMS